MTIRIRINIDLDTHHIEHAYSDVHKAMTAAGLNWESTDEWWYADGDTIPEFVIAEARKRVLDAIQRKKDLGK